MYLTSTGVYYIKHDRAKKSQAKLPKTLYSGNVTDALISEKLFFLPSHQIKLLHISILPVKTLHFMSTITVIIIIMSQLFDGLTNLINLTISFAGVHCGTRYLADFHACS